MNVGTWKTVTSQKNVSARANGARFFAPLLMIAVLAGCSSGVERDVPTAESPVVRGGPTQNEPANEARDDDNDVDVPTAEERPLIGKNLFSEPDEAPTTPANPSPYAHLDPAKVVPKVLLDKAVAYFDANKAAIANKNYISIVDYKQHSGKKRYFLIDMKSGTVRQHVVAHGKMSDPSHTGYATTFSNVSGSNMSSLGFAVTGAVYYGAHGRSLRLEGLSSTNSNMFDRAIVIHRADYVSEDYAKQGRSLGCFVFDPDFTDEIIDKIEGGSLLYTERS